MFLWIPLTFVWPAPGLVLFSSVFQRTHKFPAGLRAERGIIYGVANWLRVRISCAPSEWFERILQFPLPEYLGPYAAILQQAQRVLVPARTYQSYAITLLIWIHAWFQPEIAKVFALKTDSRSGTRSYCSNKEQRAKKQAQGEKKTQMNKKTTWNRVAFEQKSPRHN